MRYIRLIICLYLMMLSGIFWQSHGSGGSVRLLISRPNNFGYSTDPKAIWVPAVLESFLFFRLDAIDKLKIIPMEKITPLLSDHRNFEKRVSLTKYLNIAKELNATHVLYSEYEVVSGDKGVVITFKIETVDKSKESQKTQIKIPLDDLNEVLTKAVREIASMLDIAESELPDKFFDINILGVVDKNTKRLGNFIKVESKPDKAALSLSAQNCERIINEDPKMYLAYYAGSRLYSLAGKIDNAVVCTQALVDKLGSKYPKLNIQLATYYRKIHKLNEAKNAIDLIAGNSKLKAAILLEQGLIYEGMGKKAEALASFQRLLDIDKSDPGVYLHLAKLNISLLKIAKSETYVEEAAKLSGKPAGRIYFEIGNEFVSTRDNGNAISAYRKCIELTPENEGAWSALIDVQTQQGLDSAAAVSCLNLFELDIIKYEPYLEKAGNLFEKKGLIDIARQIYSDAFEKHNNPFFAVLLAKLEFKQKDCSRVKAILESLGPPWDKDRDAIAMLDKCYEDKVPPVITLNGPDPYVIEAGAAEYIEPGAKAVDEIDGDLTHFIEVSGRVNTSVVDTYMVSYKVMDASHNQATKTRKVIISDDNPPVLELVGPAEVNLELGKIYDEPGAMAIDTRDGDLSSNIRISGKVNSNVAGVYTLTYTIADKSGNTVSKTRKVEVLGDVTPPVLTLIGSVPMFIKVGEKYKESGCKAIDNIDGDLTNMRVISVKGRVNSMVPGSYKIVYTAKDRAGNLATAERVVNVIEADAKVDKTPPVISLIGGTQAKVIFIGDEYEEPGVNAIDDVDGDITAYINIEGEINPTQPGDYCIKYSVSDKSGNKAKRELEVAVRKRGESYRRERIASIGKKARKKASKPAGFQETETGLGLKKNNGRKKGMVSILTGVCGIGIGALGYLADSKISGYRDEYEKKLLDWYAYPDDDDEKARLKEECDKQKANGERAERLRNFCYFGGGAFGLGFTVNIVIPRNRK